MMKKRELIKIIFVIVLFFSCNVFIFESKKQYHDNSIFLLCSIRGEHQPVSNAERFGFFSSKLWQNYEENLKSEIDVFGAVPGYILWYIQMGENFPTHIAEHNKTLGIYTVISHDIKNDEFTPEKNNKLLKEIIDGKWDEYFRKFARQVREIEMPVYYRFGYEMNGNWFPWSGKPKLFVKAWRHVWKIFKKENATNIKWIFCPTVVWGKKNFKKDILPYYPGPQYVDIVALDGYNFGDNHDKYHSWETFFQVYSSSISGLINFNKPMWIAEIGCPADSRRQKWLKDFLDFFDNNSCFKVFFWFNENKEGEPNFRIDGDKASLYTFREWVRKVHSPQEKDNLVNNY